jgi:SAM-dependent methyltransferase
VGTTNNAADSDAALRRNLARSRRLFSAFRREQTDPDLFYGTLAIDTVAMLRGYTAIGGQTVLDVGGGPGYFVDALRAAGARVILVDADAGEMRLWGRTPPDGGIQASALALPIRTGRIDLCFSSNVLEHVPEPITMAEEMVRVTRPGGTVFLSYTTWFSPWGGHETSPWHYLGGRYAVRRYTRRHGRPPKNVFGESLFAVRAGSVIRWARRQREADVVDILPRYLPAWADPVVRVPVLREIATWNLAIVLRRR